MLTAFHILSPGQPPHRAEIDWPPAPGLTLLRSLIEPIVCGDLEHASVLWQGRRADMFVNAIGHQLGLSRNEEATTIYRANWLSCHPGYDPEQMPYIAGPAVLFERIVWR